MAVSRLLNDTWLFDTLRCEWTCVQESDELLPAWLGGGEGGGAIGGAVRPTPRWAHSAVAFGSRVLVFGGSAPGTCFNDLHSFDFDSDIDKCAWRRPVVAAGVLPPPRSGHCACALGTESMFVFGGNTTEVSFNDLWQYKVGLATWTRIVASAGTGPTPSCRVGHTLTAIGSRLLVLGGREYSTNHFDPSLHSFNVTSKQWCTVPLERAGGGETKRTGHCATVHAGRILLFGGLDHNGRLLDDLWGISLMT